jgi:hypothetical protein
MGPSMLPETICTENSESYPGSSFFPASARITLRMPRMIPERMWREVTIFRKIGPKLRFFCISDRSTIYTQQIKKLRLTPEAPEGCTYLRKKKSPESCTQR